VISTARTVGVEVGRLHAVFLQILSCRTVFLYRSSRRNVVGSNAVAQNGQHASAMNVLHWHRPERHIVEIRGAADVGGIIFPSVGLAFGNGQAAPAMVAMINLAVAAAEHIGGDRFADHFVYLALRGPDISEIDRLAIFTLAKGIFAHIYVDAPSKRESDH